MTKNSQRDVAKSNPEVGHDFAVLYRYGIQVDRNELVEVMVEAFKQFWASPITSVRNRIMYIDRFYREDVMSKTCYLPEDIFAKLREADILISQGICPQYNP